MYANELAGTLIFFYLEENKSNKSDELAETVETCAGSTHSTPPSTRLTRTTRGIDHVASKEIEKATRIPNVWLGSTLPLTNALIIFPTKELLHPSLITQLKLKPSNHGSS